jgi:hypothetical protein
MRIERDIVLVAGDLASGSLLPPVGAEPDLVAGRLSSGSVNAGPRQVVSLYGFAGSGKMRTGGFGWVGSSL